MTARRSKSGEVYCSVVDCHNSTLNTKGREPRVKFYRFPGKWYEQERRQAWITAVRRLNPDGTPWMPSKGARVCSTHFVGNCKNDMSAHPSYIPTIFPPVYKMKAPDAQGAEWYQRCLIQATSSRLQSMETDNSSQTATEAEPTALEAFVSKDGTLEEHEHQMDYGMEDDGLPTSDTDDVKAPTTADISPIQKADVACQTESSTARKLILLLSMTNSAEASTQVTHTEHIKQIAATDRNWERTSALQNAHG